MITDRSEKGKRVYEFLKKELQIPDGVTNFSVHLGVNELITVDCTYFPRDCDHNWVETTVVKDKYRNFVCTECGAQKVGSKL